MYFIGIAVATLFSFGSIDASAPDSKTEPKEIVNPPSPEVQKMIDRVYEIKEMDFSKLSMSEKKQLKTELKETRKQLKDVDVIYIPLGTVIIIVLLLLLL